MIDNIMDTAVKRIRGMSDRQAKKLGLRVISPSYLLHEKDEETRFMDGPRAIAKVSLTDTKGNRYLELLKQKTIIELYLKASGHDPRRTIGRRLKEMQLLSRS